MRRATAALRNPEFDVACVPGYELRSSRFVTTVTCCFTGSRGLSVGESCSSVSADSGVQRAMFEPIGMYTNPSRRKRAGFAGESATAVSEGIIASSNGSAAMTAGTGSRNKSSSRSTRISGMRFWRNRSAWMLE